MKKTLLLGMGILALTAANAQKVGQPSATVNARSCGTHTVYERSMNRPATHKSLARTTSVTIATEDFGSGSATALPTGWTSGIINGSGSWHWSVDSSTSGNSMGYMHSTTTANGWMIFDADSINNDCSCSPSAWLQSPAYNCFGHATVRLNFEEFYGHVFDTCEVWVSTDPTFATFTRYPLLLNNGLDFGTTTDNTTKIHLNITDAAAGHSAVYIRYVYYGDDFFDLSWMIDDMSLTELDPHDAAVAGPFILAPDPSALNGSMFNTPLAFVDTIHPGARLSNLGANPETSLPTTATIFQGTTPVYTQTNTVPVLPFNAVDSVIHFPGFKPNAIGHYTCTYSTSLTGDADTLNNKDTIAFNVTDTIWMQNGPDLNTNFFVRGASFGTFSSMLGTRFDVPSGAIGDTVSGFGVAISPLSRPTNAGGKVSVQLYSRRKTDTDWVYVGTSVARPISASDTSSFATVKWADFRIDTAASGGVAPFVLQPGTSYVAMLQTQNVTTDLAVFASKIPPIPGMNGTLALSDTSNNDGGHTFHQRSPLDTGITGFVPFIRMYFGNVPVDRTGVHEVSAVTSLGAAYPDPANSSVNVPFTVAADANVTVTLTNMAGQVVRSKTIHVPAATPARATFNTSDLPAGIYNYCIGANGGTANGRIVITH